MLASTLKQRIQIQEKAIVQGALGQTVTWKFVKEIFGRYMLLDVRTIAAYQQLNTSISGKFILRGTVEIDIGKHRMLYGSSIYEPQVSAKHHDGVTEVLVVSEAR